MRKHRFQSGFTIVELMVALTIGLLVAAAAGAVFVQSKSNYLQNEQLGRTQENGRLAIKLLQRDLSMASYFGQIEASTIPGSVTNDNANIATACGNASSLVFAPVNNNPVIQVVDGAAANAIPDAFPCIAAANWLPGTDAVMIKRVADSSLCTVNAVVGGNDACAPGPDIYLLTNGIIGRLHIGTVLANPAAAPPLPRTDWRYIVHVYFIRPWSAAVGDGLPNLCRMALQGNNFVAQCLAEGIEDLQVQLGVDTANDRIVDFYSDAPTGPQIQRVRSAKFYVLARSLDTLPNTLNDKTYQYAGVVRGPFNDQRLRRVYSSSAQIRNRR